MSVGKTLKPGGVETGGQPIPQGSNLPPVNLINGLYSDPLSRLRSRLPESTDFLDVGNIFPEVHSQPNQDGVDQRGFPNLTNLFENAVMHDQQPPKNGNIAAIQNGIMEKPSVLSPENSLQMVQQPNTAFINHQPPHVLAPQPPAQLQTAAGQVQQQISDQKSANSPLKKFLKRFGFGSDGEKANTMVSFNRSKPSKPGKLSEFEASASALLTNSQQK